MSTYETTYNEGRGGGGLVLLLLALAAGILLMAALGVQLSSHATDRHGDEAIAIRKCLDKAPVPFMVMKHRFEDTFYLLCQLDDGRLGAQAVTKDGIEKTAFVPKDGSIRAVLDYFQKFATRYKGALPWE